MFIKNKKNVIIPDGITRIVDYGDFKHNNHIKSIMIPESVKTIGFADFNGCTKLENVILSDGLQEINGTAFAFTPNLKNITIPRTVNIIKYNAFYHSGIEQIILPDNIILEDGFVNAKELETIQIGYGKVFISITKNNANEFITQNKIIPLTMFQYFVVPIWMKICCITLCDTTNPYICPITRLDICEDIIIRNFDSVVNMLTIANNNEMKLRVIQLKHEYDINHKPNSSDTFIQGLDLD